MRGWSPGSPARRLGRGVHNAPPPPARQPAGTEPLARPSYPNRRTRVVRCVTFLAALLCAATWHSRTRARAPRRVECPAMGADEPAGQHRSGQESLRLPAAPVCGRWPAVRGQPREHPAHRAAVQVAVGKLDAWLLAILGRGCGRATRYTIRAARVAVSDPSPCADLALAGALLASKLLRGAARCPVARRQRDAHARPHDVTLRRAVRMAGNRGGPPRQCSIPYPFSCHSKCTYWGHLMWPSVRR